MSVLKKIDNIKIPYPSEGVVRTAQLDDTVAPSESVQLAVNMNFDRIGAIQTRPGITEYATEIDGPVRNFGTLNRNYIQEGYTNIRKFLGNTQFATDGDDFSMTKIDSEHFIIFWKGTSTQDGYAQVMELLEGSGTVTPLGTPVLFDTTNSSNKCIAVNSYTFLNVWTGVGNDGYAQVFTIDNDYNITAEGAKFEFDIAGASFMSIAKIDSTHFICFYSNDSDNGVAQILEITGSLNVINVGTPLTFDSSANVQKISCVPIGNGTHFLTFWRSSTTAAKAQVFSVNTGTWATASIGSALTFTTEDVLSLEAISLEDGQHFVNVWGTFLTEKNVARVFNVNPSTYAVTVLGSLFNFDPGSLTLAQYIQNVSMEDGIHFTIFWKKTGGGSGGYSRIFEVNLSTFEISNTSNLLFFTEGNNYMNSAILMTPYRIVNFWINENSIPGNTVNAVFDIFGDPTTSNYLYAQNGSNDILNWDGANWTSRRSGLVSTNKARFAQYLGYIWMVNGGLGIGDQVKTSNGGAFGTDLVPDNFPEGDFISAGFEGRIWVADAVQGIIYYSDIVQFTPPGNYTITYDQSVNFISNISPQTGQKMTGLMEVPRALLVFTQDSITRIYGATSLDSYPAYNVGTYSQESIVKTKTGIFFHHSSGFYQFDYGSQPIEISRRVIDFVQAIPRSYYDDITGVYDGFDAVEWTVGPVTVEGVTFSNCVMRFTISTQTWTIYDYVGNNITAMITYDNGTTINHLIGTYAGKIGALDTGTTDFGEPFYFEYIDRWRSFSDMYYQTKNIGSINVYSENAAGTNIMYQVQKSGPNVWEPVGTIDENNNCLIPTTDIGDFDVLRFRIAGNTRGVPIVIHGIEIPEVTIKGQDKN